MDKSREQFESWFRRFGSEDECTNMLQLNSYGTNYLHPHTDLAWIAWQASREAVEIELPKYHEYTNQDTTRAQAEKSAYNSGVYDSAESFRAAGLKVKEE